VLVATAGATALGLTMGAVGALLFRRVQIPGFREEPSRRGTTLWRGSKRLSESSPSAVSPSTHHCSSAALVPWDAGRPAKMRRVGGPRQKAEVPPHLMQQLQVCQQNRNPGSRPRWISTGLPPWRALEQSSEDSILRFLEAGFNRCGLELEGRSAESSSETRLAIEDFPQDLPLVPRSSAAGVPGIGAERRPAVTDPVKLAASSQAARESTAGGKRGLRQDVSKPDASLEAPPLIPFWAEEVQEVAEAQEPGSSQEGPPCGGGGNPGGAGAPQPETIAEAAALTAPDVPAVGQNTPLTSKNGPAAKSPCTTQQQGRTREDKQLESVCGAPVGSKAVASVPAVPPAFSEVPRCRGRGRTQNDSSKAVGKTASTASAPAGGPAGKHGGQTSQPPGLDAASGSQGSKGSQGSLGMRVPKRLESAGLALLVILNSGDSDVVSSINGLSKQDVNRILKSTQRQGPMENLAQLPHVLERRVSVIKLLSENNW